MQKELVICIIIIVGIIILNVITQNYTKESIKVVTEELLAFKEEIKKDEKTNEELFYSAEEIIKLWKDRYNNMAYYIEHDELEKVETELKSLKANIEVEEYEQGVPDIEKAIFILEHIDQKFKLDIRNLF